MILTNYDFANDLDRYINDLIEQTHLVYEQRRGVRDDTLPNITPILGIGDYSAFIGGEIVFTDDTSWSRPILKKLDDWKKIDDLGSAIWYTRFLELSERLLERARPVGIPYLRGFFSPLDLAHALRGDKIYTDFYDDPEGTHQLLDFCARATIKFAEDIYSLVNKYLGDTEYGNWFTDGFINMSEDIACMISPQLYREFGAPHTQMVINHFGQGLMHCHSRALYMVEEIARLKNVKNIWLATDPGHPKPIDKLAELIEKSNNVGLSIDCESFAEIAENINIAKEGNIAFCLPVDSIQEANKVTDFIREHSNI